MREKIVAGNWKMNCNREDALSLVTEISGMLNDEQQNIVTVILAPPFVHLAGISHLLKGSSIKISAQNCSSEISGAFTGEVSASMIKSVGCEYIIIGHSERRNYFSETNEMLAKKTERTIDEGLKPIFCIGELLPEREAGLHELTVQKQLEESLFHLPGNKFSEIVIAYEPVWAIGTGKTATPAQAQNMHAFIRTLIESKYGKEIADNTSILYGGSCNESNAKELFSLPDVDGGLIGGASLKSRSFVNIIKSY